MKPRDLALILSLGAVWGVSFVFITIALRDISPVLLAAVRFDVVAVVMLAWAGWKTLPLVPKGRREWTAVTAAGLLSIAGYHAFLFWGQNLTTEGVASIIIGLNPILSTVVAKAILPSERVSGRNLLGLGLGLSGVAALALLKPGATFDLQGIGELAVLAAIVCWAIGSVTVKRTGASLPLPTLILWQSLIGAVAMHIVSLAVEPHARFNLTASSIGALGYMTVVASCLGLPVYYYILRRVGPVRTAMVSYIAAISTSIVAVWWLGHPIEGRSYLAFGLIVLGFLLAMQPAPGPAPAAASVEPGEP
jgi:drug/metabolite transporter (DMT)-like permease